MKAGNRDLSHRPKTIAEDDVLKRNTDCVYFLASPLTCKKGSECEYRHSEDARMNPRDCWFWLNGNCLNAKCSFRHPPLDGLLGTTASSPKKVSLPPTPTASSSTQLSAIHTPAYSSGKQATPCFYFQKGLCLKGDRCPFMHGPQPIDSLVPQPLAPKVSVSFSELHTDKKAFGGLEKCTQQKKILQENIIKPVAAKQPTKAESTILSKNRIVVGETMPRPISFDDDLPRYKPTNFPPVIGGNSASRTDRGRQAQPSDDWNFRNGMEPGEFLRELSPGFDVLTVGAHRDSDYYQNEDEFRRMTARERHLDDTPSKFDNGRLADYNKRETFKDQYPREQRRVSSERILERSSEREKRGFTRAESPGQVNESDLRYRLSKQRRIDGSRTAVSPDRRGDFNRRDDRSHQVVDHRYQGRSHRDPPHLLPHEGSISNRLQGRISLLGKPSPDSDHNDSHMERGRYRGRLSPGRPLTSSHQGRLQDRIKPRVQEDFTTEGGNFRGPSIRRDDVDNNTLNFSGPKSLAELKSAKFSGYGEERKNTKIGKIEGHQELEGGFPSFEGPKSLNVILKRKREEKTADSVDALVTEKHSDVPSSNKEVNHEDVEDEGLISAEGDEVITHEGRSSAQKESEFETEDVIMDRVEDQEPESFDQRDGEFDYEQVDGGDLKTEEDENVDLEDEYLDDEEDGDDFAKRIGVMFS